MAYGTDPEVVIANVEESAREHEVLSKTRLPEVRFIDFSESSLDFDLLIWGTEMFDIDRAISEIRITINKKFKEAEI